MDRLFLVDASGYLFRSYYAIKGMSNSQGVSTNALFGFIRSLLKLIDDFSVTHIAAVFDGPNNKQSRLALYPEYKANRSEAPKDLPEQILWAQEFCQLYGIPTLVQPGFEADDVMGSIARWAAGSGTEVFLCTSDKDMAQLVSPEISMLITHKANQQLDRDAVFEKWGVYPEQIVDWLALTGDSSDNVPGVPGIGAKGAAKLLSQYGSLEGVFAGLDAMKTSKQKERLIENKDLALLSQKLVLLQEDTAIPKEKNAYCLNKPDLQKLSEFYRTMDFHSLLKSTAQQGKKESAKVCPEVRIVQDDKDLDEFIAQFLEAEKICIDTETTGVDPMQADLVGIGFFFGEDKLWYVPFNGVLSVEVIQQALRPLLFDSNKFFYGHNIKYDIHILQRAGLPIQHIGFDTMVASYLLDSQSRRHGLDALTLTFFDHVMTPISDLIGKGKKAIGMEQVLIEKVAKYCGEDVFYTHCLFVIFTELLKKRDLEELYYNLELPLLSVLVKMEQEGIFVDVEQLHQMNLNLQKEIAELEKQIHDFAGESFNVKSPKQLGAILFEKMAIRPPKKTATGFSTSAEVLEQLSDYPIAQAVLEFRQLEKLRSTYTETLVEQVNPVTGRIHCTFHQSVAATGRLSCTDPNLQNIPIRTERGREIRGAFRPESADHLFLSADYSQIELRLLAHLSKDPGLINAFQEGKDIHTATASQVFGVPLEDVTKEQRYQAKAVNFGILYGQGPFGLSKEIGVSFKDAASFIKTYFSQYPKVEEFIQDCKDQAREKGCAVTIIGRERLLPDMDAKNAAVRAAAERLAVNTPLQGSAADLIKEAMIRLLPKLQEQNLSAKMVLQIHDELLFEVHEKEIASVSLIVQQTMEQVYSLCVPLVVDLSTGKNWRECG